MGGAKVTLNLCKTHEKMGGAKVYGKTQYPVSPGTSCPETQAGSARPRKPCISLRRGTHLRAVPRWVGPGAVWTPLSARDLVGSCVGDPTTMRDYSLLPRIILYYIILYHIILY